MIDLSALDTPALAYFHIDVLPRHATHCLKTMAEHIDIHEITTNRGKKRRKIYAPNKQLGWIQKRIRHGLLLKIPVEDCVHGFVRERGTVTNAHVHAHRRCRWVMNLDLKNFFPSISTARVYGLFKKLFGFNDRVAGHMARLTTFDNHLCQGFCTSPDLANFVAWKLDRRLMALAQKVGIHYTRYADDLTFSSPDDKPGAQGIRRLVEKIVAEEDFKVNQKKVAIMGVGRRQVVTGLVVSEHGVNLPRRTRRLLRSAVHHWPQQTPERRQSILGWLSYLHAVDPTLAATLRRSIDEADDNRIWTKDVGSHPFAVDISRR